MTTLIKNFIADESGAVTVDWVVLTAAVIALGIAAYGKIKNTAELVNKKSDEEANLFTDTIFKHATTTGTN